LDASGVDMLKMYAVECVLLAMGACSTHVYDQPCYESYGVQCCQSLPMCVLKQQQACDQHGKLDEYISYAARKHHPPMSR
jgi:hypothetical protein